MGMEPDQTTPVDYRAWTVEALAEAGEVSEAYIRRLCRNGVIKAHKFGQAWFIPYAEGQRWLSERKSMDKVRSENKTELS